MKKFGNAVLASVWGRRRSFIAAGELIATLCQAVGFVFNQIL